MMECLGERLLRGMIVGIIFTGAGCMIIGIIVGVAAAGRWLVGQIGIPGEYSILASLLVFLFIVTFSFGAAIDPNWDI